ncbi:MAG: hypothetical protein GF401_16040 [Chitinivibrionales bacterium]|nr:hypothetical protein [Chitinivibrionales bacterium]
MKISFNKYKKSRSTRWKRWVLVCLLSTLFCVERDNPWDPANGCPKELLQEIRESTRPAIDSTLNTLSAIAGDALQIDSTLAAVTSANDSISAINDGIRIQNDSIAAVNDSFKNINSSLSGCDPLFSLHTLDSLKSLVLFDADSQAKALQSRASLESLRVVSLFAAAGDECPTDKVFAASYKDSIATVLDSTSSALSLRFENALRYSDTPVAINQDSIKPYNEWMYLHNADVGKYNLQLLDRSTVCDCTVIDNADTLLDRIINIQPGQVVVLSPDTFSTEFTINTSGTEGNTIVLRAAEPGKTIFKTSTITVSDADYIKIDGFVFTGSDKSSLRISSNCKAIIITRCIFTHGAQHGIDIVDSDAEIRDCRIYHNGGHGVNVSSGDGSNRVRFHNSLIVHNRLNGIHGLTSELDIAFCTISHNGQNGIYLDEPRRPVRIANSLVTWHENGWGIYRETTAFSGELFAILNSNLYGNKQGIFADSTYLQFPVLAHDPLYVDHANDNYSLEDAGEIMRLQRDEGIVVGYREYLP